MTLPETLITAVKQRKAILFAGAGLSCHLGLPSFDALKAHIGEQLRLRDWNAFEFPALAEYYLLKKPNREELLSWIEQTWRSRNSDILASEPHRCIVELDFPVIYTTNYDSLLECAFASARRPFKKVVGVRDLAEATPGQTEIIKFHGDFSDPETIVLTESSFLRRMSLDGPLDIRLRSDSVARPLLFVGYSMSDPNIRYLLFKLRQLWEQHSEITRRPNSYVLMVEENEVQQQILLDRGVEPILAAEGDASTGLISFFRTLLQAVRSE
jgi:SIR2-like domain